MWTCPKCNERIEDQFDSCWKCAGEVQPKAPTKPRARGLSTTLVVLVVVFELWLAAEVAFQPVNLVKVSFRREQRAAVLRGLSKDPSPENRAALQEELRLAREHVGRRQFTKAGVLLAVLFGADAIVIYLRRQHDLRANTPA
jgi:hypothetical protein